MNAPTTRPAQPIVHGEQDSLSTGATYLAAGVVSGRGSFQHLPEFLPIPGDTSAPPRALVVSDEAMADHPSLHELQHNLQKRGVEVELYADVAAEPTLASVQAAYTARSRWPGKYAYIIGFGGGSAMDTAKLIAAANDLGVHVDKLIEQRRLQGPTSGSLTLVPTTSGTGAETSPNAVLSLDTHKLVISGQPLLPSITVLDPTLTLTMPPSITAASGADALAHAIESYISSNATAYTAAHSISAIRIIAHNLQNAYHNPSDIQSREQMLLGAHLAGMSLSASTLLGHSIAYTVAARTGLSHGITTGLALPYCIAYNSGSVPSKVGEIARLFRVVPASLPVAVMDLMHSIGIPTTLREVGIRRADIPAMVNECMAEYPRPNNPEPFEVERLTRLYNDAIDGDVIGIDVRMHK